MRLQFTHTHTYLKKSNMYWVKSINQLIDKNKLIIEKS